MNISKPIVLTPDIEPRFQSFVLIEATSSRLGDNDIFIQGDQVQEIYDRLVEELSESDDIKAQIILNRISKIGQMMELLTTHSGVILTKFFDRVWRRYAYVSNVGEPFLDLETFSKFFPEYCDDKYALLAQRIDDDDEESTDSSNDDGTEERAEDSTESVDTVEVEAVNEKTPAKETVTA